MVSGISSSNSMQRPMQSSQTLTDDQKTTVNDIISNYDSSNMTKADFDSLMVEFQDAGIPPSEEIGSLLDAAGFEKHEGKPPEGVKGGQRPEPPEFITELMDKLENGEITEEEVQSFLQNLQNESNQSSGLIMDNYA